MEKSCNLGFSRVRHWNDYHRHFWIWRYSSYCFDRNSHIFQNLLLHSSSQQTIYSRIRSGHFINQLRLALLRTDIHLPTGLKQGSFQLRCWESNQAGVLKKHKVFYLHQSSVGGLTVIPVQAEFYQQSLVFQEVANWRTEQDLLNHAVAELCGREPRSQFHERTQRQL